MRNWLATAALGLAVFAIPGKVRAADDGELRKEVQALKKEIEDLRKDKAASKPLAASKVDKAVDNKYGPNATVTTKEGKLTISGLIQVWYQHIQNDNHGRYYDPGANPGVSNLPIGAVTWANATGAPITRTYIGPQSGSQISGITQNTLAAGATGTGGGTDEAVDAGDNDTYRIRRTELKFTMDIHENVQAQVMIDPARENNYSQSNRTYGRGEFDGAVFAPSVTGAGGTGGGANMLQDAFIKIHKLIPHHETQTGQFKPPFGEEGIRSSSELDFVERSWVGIKGDNRDLGSTIRGFWWDDRFQYWLGFFNAAGDFHGTRGQFQNRGDTNDEKDFVYRLLVRPVWKNETWGSLELGFSHQFGVHGEGRTDDLGRNNATTSAISAAGIVANDFNGAGGQQLETNAYRMAAWFSYKPGSVVRGWWIKGEWAMYKDVPNEGSVATPFISAGSPLYLNPQGGSSAALNGLNGRNIPFDVTTGQYYQNQTVAPVVTQGFYLATGYKLSDSIWKDKVPFWLKPVEFAYRYDHANNVVFQDQHYPQRHVNTFYTDVHTVGLNYYIKGHNAKFQLNYNIVKDPKNTYFVSDGSNAALGREGTHYRTRGMDNNSLVANFQVAW
jgi:hypothetical protein